MAKIEHKYTGMDIYNPSFPLTNYGINDTDGLTYNPQTVPDPVYSNDIIGVASHTHHAIEDPNVMWIGVQCLLTHSTTEATPSYQTVIGLYGLNDNHTEELIGENIYTSIDATPTTEVVSFNLIGGGCQPQLTKVYKSLIGSDAVAAGTIKVNIPFRYENYESITFNYASTSVTPTTSDNDYSYVVFTTPGSWSEATPVTCTVKEWDGEDYTTNYLTTSTRNTLQIGYDGVDKYDALRVKVETTTTTTPYTVKVDNLRYSYEVQ